MSNAATKVSSRNAKKYQAQAVEAYHWARLHSAVAAVDGNGSTSVTHARAWQKKAAEASLKARAALGIEV